ncbi:Cna protein B-type domain./Gram positive anchor [Butyrivibrio fibrisolvens 16/4]|nr:Cna protein B-type domain./Gram positive anchor [Butyrivibrio fibrisolvens 16/4]
MDLSELVAAGVENANAGKTLTIEYDATVLGVNGYVNQAYDSTYELKENGEPKNTPPEVYGYSADIELTKYNSNKTELLGGAKFVITHKNNTLQFVYNTVDNAYELYQNNVEYSAEKYAFKDGNLVVSSTVETSSEKDTLGKLTVKGLEEGDYIFEETEAPEGYAINRDKLCVTIKDQSKDLKTVKYENMTEDQKRELHKTTEFFNSKLAKLPFTGGIGTTIFTVLGIILMSAAAALYFLTKKKDSVN